MWSVSTGVQTLATACGGRWRRRSGLSSRSRSLPPPLQVWRRQARMLAAVRARLHRSLLTRSHAGNACGLQAMQAGFPARPGAGRLV